MNGLDRPPVTIQAPFSSESDDTKSYALVHSFSRKNLGVSEFLATPLLGEALLGAAYARSVRL